ncbi:hypothetical protein CYMTET_53245 [Cymbomonas tetramitiformis]|uniref:Uncharacterized protein n=1 Tax=Cymbomonas tetramitiformis TaxID=36881 RepID=A0AAE0BII4_9CHLO|nr:hypothetical protein CYMTET_53245 [Cymbomonas tetramitiformis]
MGSPVKGGKGKAGVQVSGVRATSMALSMATLEAQLVAAKASAESKDRTLTQAQERLRDMKGELEARAKQCAEVALQNAELRTKAAAAAATIEDRCACSGSRE